MLMSSVSSSCMWLEDSQSSSMTAVRERKFSNLFACVRRVIRGKYSVRMGDINDWSSLHSFLIRIRRCSSRLRCFFIPRWIFREDNAIPTSESCTWDRQEERLSAFSGQRGVPISESILQQIDQCCLLMESYVRLDGNGDRDKLVFERGVSGGSGRGPVYEYSLLCDVLNTPCGKAKELGLEMLGPVRKLLAKDMMA